MLKTLVLGLELQVSVLDDFVQDPLQNLKLLHYPPHTSTDTRQFGAAEHTEFGCITLLLQQPGPHGLQAYHAIAKSWIDVPANGNVYICNMGDLMQEWTEGRYRSTVHRVVNASSGRSRYSVPCCYEGNFSATNPFDPDEEGGETVKEHVRRKFDAIHGISS